MGKNALITRSFKDLPDELTVIFQCMNIVYITRSFKDSQGELVVISSI